jgi:membrane fusion protein, multidrug efflux system
MKEPRLSPTPAAKDDPLHVEPAPRPEPDTGSVAVPLEPGATTVRSARRPFLVLGAIALLVAAGIGGYLVYSAGQETTDDAQLAADVVLIAARVSGQVVRVAVTENQRVKRGELLVEIDPADYSARLEQAEAELETSQAQAAAADAQIAVVEATSRGGLLNAEAQVSGSGAAVIAAHAQVAAARAGLARAQTDTHKATLELGRVKALAESGATAQANLDNSQAAYDSAMASEEQAIAQVTAAEQNEQSAMGRVGEAKGRLGQSQSVAAQIAQARANAALAHARVKSTMAALELAKLQFSYTQVVASCDGIASKLSAHPGTLVQVGQALLALVPAQAYVLANFKETQIGEMRPGQRAEIRVAAFSGRPLLGRVESLSGGTGAVFSLLPPDNATGNFVKVVQRVPVRIALIDPPSELPLRPGLSAEVTVHVSGSNHHQ